MTRLALFLAACLLSFGVTADQVSVKVIALFAGKALLQVGDQQKVVSKGETFAGVLLQEAHGRGAVVVIDGETLELKLNQSIAGNFKKRDRGSIRVVPDALGMGEGEGTQQDGVDHAEDGGIRADADGQGDDGEQADAWVLEQQPNTVADILESRVHGPEARR